MTTTYNLNGKTTQDIAMIVRNYLEMNEGMESQTFATPEGGAVIQARSRGGSFKQFVGLDKAITVKINPISETHVSVDIGEGKWIDKGIAMTVSWFVLWPLAVTSGIGMYKQSQLPKKINSVIAQNLCYGF
ncbi:MAG: hypothetical protein E7627_08445 [Ruminococcaceae bacterium]|nr:hypothetical protein [Oscillospiraceae bacterium]